MDRAMKQSSHQFHKIFFHISKYLTCNAERNEYSNFININANLYAYIIRDEDDLKQKGFIKLDTASWSRCRQ